MKIGTKEHYEMIENFEKNFNYIRLDKEENRELWKKGIIYQNGETNNLFKAFSIGYSFARLNYMN